jgi:hypothetical protein
VTEINVDGPALPFGRGMEITTQIRTGPHRIDWARPNFKLDLSLRGNVTLPAEETRMSVRPRGASALAHWLCVPDQI